MRNWDKQKIINNIANEVQVFLKKFDYTDIIESRKHFHTWVTMISISISLFIIAGIANSILKMNIFNSPYIIIPILAIAIICGFATAILTLFYFRKIFKPKALKIEKKGLPNEMYKAVFDNVFNSENIIFEGVFLLNTEHGDANYYFKFTVPNKAVINWCPIDKKEEIRVSSIRDDTTEDTTEEVWYYQYNLQVHLQEKMDIDDFSYGIKYDQKDPSDFVSESIDFNTRFSVLSNNLLHVTKIFTPSAMENLLITDYNVPKKHWYKYSNSKFFSSYLSSKFSVSQDRKLNHFNNRLTGNIAKDKIKVANKIYEDFTECFGHIVYVEALNIFSFKITPKG